MVNLTKKILCIALEGASIVLFLQGILWILIVEALSLTGWFSSSLSLLPSFYGYISVVFLLLSSLSFLVLQAIKSRVDESSVTGL